MINKCRWCGATNIKSRPRPDTPHYAEMFCGHCGKHCYWIKNPNSPRTTNRTSRKTTKEICDFHRFKEEGCFFCLRKRNEIGKNETLTIDHIQELDKGGEDTIENMQVLCSACHKLKNWARLYMCWHLIKEDDNKDTSK